jgi:uncharacterized Zn finger protein (UPF0148 family)
MTVQPGTRWYRKRTQGHADLVIVVKVSASVVHFRERDLGAGFSHLPLGMFLGTYVPEKTPACQRCGSLTVKDGHRYCDGCTSLICAVRNKKKKKEENAVLTTTDNAVIEQKRREASPVSPVPAVGRVASVTVAPHSATLHWRITARRVVVEEQVFEVDGDSVIDALATVDSQAPGYQVTDVHLLDQ